MSVDAHAVAAAEESVGGRLRKALPAMYREGFLPLLAFYLGQRLAGLEAGVAAASVVGLLVYVRERRAGRDGLLVRLSIGFVAVQGIVALVSQSGTAFLAAPVLASFAWALAFLGSAAIGRPLAGALSRSWELHPRGFEHPALDHAYGVVSVVWGLYLLARSGLRLAVLSSTSAGPYVAFVFVTGAPLTIALLAWSFWYVGRVGRRLAD